MFMLANTPDSIMADVCIFPAGSRPGFRRGIPTSLTGPLYPPPPPSSINVTARCSVSHALSPFVFFRINK